MGDIRRPLPTKLFFGMLSPEPDLFLECASILSKKYGKIDLESDVMLWNITDYYREEMGTVIYRKFIFFKDLMDPGDLSNIKLFSNTLEDRYKVAAPSGFHRRINIDPGYVTEAKVVLATTKDFAHRLYIGRNIYAEVTLRYNSKDHTFASLEHTYFDFRSDGYRNLFNTARLLLRKQLER